MSQDVWEFCMAEIRSRKVGGLAIQADSSKVERVSRVYAECGLQWLNSYGSNRHEGGDVQGAGHRGPEK